MTPFMAGFVCALVLAAVVLVLITYCMFFNERHKSELNQLDIGDLKHRNQVLPNMLSEDDPKKKRDLTAAIFVLPGRKHKKDDSYERRPDYPENPVPVMTTGTEELIRSFNEDVGTLEKESQSNDYCFQIDSGSQYHSDV